MKERLPLVECQWKLAKLWLIVAGVLAALLIVQTMGNKYGDASGQAWEWYVTAIVPILTLILGALRESARKQAEHATVDAKFFRLSLWTSVFYLAAVLAIPLVQPLIDPQALEFLDRSKVGLGIIQGIVAFPLGVYFVSSSDAQASGQGSA